MPGSDTENVRRFQRRLRRSRLRNASIAIRELENVLPCLAPNVSERRARRRRRKLPTFHHLMLVVVARDAAVRGAAERSKARAEDSTGEISFRRRGRCHWKIVSPAGSKCRVRD